MKAKNIILTSILFVFINISLLYTQSSNSNDSWITGRQMVSVNLNPGYAIWGGMLLNTVVNNGVDISKLVGVNFGEVANYFNYMNAKTTSWYIPSVSYSLFVHDRSAVEAGLGFYSSKFDLVISKENTIKLLESMSSVPAGAESLIGIDTTFKSSFYYLPLTFGVKFYTEDRKFYNIFKFGLDSVFYTIDTLNGVTGVKTSHTIYDGAVYVSYEFGWSIELFPTRNWDVKPTIDISLLEIGYYFRPWHQTAYNAIYDNLGLLTSGLLDNLPIPSWDKLPEFVRTYSRIRFALFPRIGFSLRF